MAEPATGKTTYEKLADDSGYLSDLVHAAQRNHDNATALFASSSASGDT
jgi:hypothetical protein